MASLRRAVRWAVVETPWLAMWLVAWPVLALGRRAIITQPRPLPFMPDLAQLELVVVSALRLELLVGPPSRNGFWHLGPVPYYWQAPFYAATGRSPVGMQLAAAVASALCLALIVLAVDRMAGVRGRWVAVAVCLAWIARFGLSGLASAWNPSLTSLPLALCLVSLAAVLDEHPRFLPVAAISGTYAAQAHLGSLPVVLAGAAVVVVWALRRRRAGRVVRWGRTLVVAGASLAVLWAPVAWDQVAGEQNLTRLGGYLLLEHDQPTPYTFSVDPHAHTQSPADAVEQVALQASQVQVGASGWGSFDLILAAEVEPDATSVAVLTFLVGAAALLGVASRRAGARGVTALCGLGVVALGVTALGTWRIPGEVFYYYSAHAAGVGLVLWLAVALALVEVAGALRPGSRAAVRSGAAAGVAIVAVLLGAPHADGFTRDRPPAAFFSEADSLGPRIEAALDSVEERLPDVVLLDGPYPSGGARIIALEVELLRRGVRVVLPERWAMFGTTAQQRSAAGATPIWVHSRRRDAPEGMDHLVTIPDGIDGTDVIEVWIGEPSP